MFQGIQGIPDSPWKNPFILIDTMARDVVLQVVKFTENHSFSSQAKKSGGGRSKRYNYVPSTFADYT